MVVFESCCRSFLRGHSFESCWTSPLLCSNDDYNVDRTRFSSRQQAFICWSIGDVDFITSLTCCGGTKIRRDTARLYMFQRHTITNYIKATTTEKFTCTVNVVVEKEVIWHRSRPQTKKKILPPTTQNANRSICHWRWIKEKLPQRTRPRRHNTVDCWSVLPRNFEHHRVCFPDHNHLGCFMVMTTKTKCSWVLQTTQLLFVLDDYGQFKIQLSSKSQRITRH